MVKTTIQALAEFGQSVWLDYISRSTIDSGKLRSMINMGVRGVTSNPSIFNNAVSKSTDYDVRIKELHTAGKTVFEIYDELTVQDIQDAADMFYPIWKETRGVDGYISLEVNPKLAYDTDQTVQEGKRLFTKVNRPNLMLKVPATEPGYPAVTSLITEGINVNITLIFSLQQYMKTAQAYLNGVEQFIKKGGDARTVCSVASIFVSRIDTLTDTLIEDAIDGAHDEAMINMLETLRGKAAVANSSLIYRNYCDLLASQRFKTQQAQGAQVQRVLWGSTSTKNSDYNDIKYIVELIGKNTVNTIPEETLEAFLDHGIVTEALTSNALQAQRVIADLHRMGIDINTVCTTLLTDGVVAFDKAFDALLESIEKKAKA